MPAVEKKSKSQTSQARNLERHIGGARAIARDTNGNIRGFVADKDEVSL